MRTMWAMALLVISSNWWITRCTAAPAVRFCQAADVAGARLARQEDLLLMINNRVVQLVY